MCVHLLETARKTVPSAAQSAACSPNSTVGSVTPIFNRLVAMVTYTRIVKIKLLCTIAFETVVTLSIAFAIATSFLVLVTC